MMRKGVEDDDGDDGSAAIILPSRPRTPREPPPFRVHPSNWSAFQVFEACHTQWRISIGVSGAIYHGIDYSSLVAVIDAMGGGRRKTFNQVRLIEAGALSVINEQ
jgi:hypothetical protein